MTQNRVGGVFQSPTLVPALSVGTRETFDDDVNDDSDFIFLCFFKDKFSLFSKIKAKDNV